MFKVPAIYILGSENLNIRNIRAAGRYKVNISSIHCQSNVTVIGLTSQCIART